MRIAIAGCPRAGKTTLAKRLAAELDVTAFHADDLIATHEWSAASAELARKLLEPGPYVVEGVAVVRALRKALDASNAKPCDRVLWMDKPHQALNAGQQRMFDADVKRMAELEAELVRRGVEVVRERRAPAQMALPTARAPQKQAPADEAGPGPQLIDVSDSSTRWGNFGGRGF